MRTLVALATAALVNGAGASPILAPEAGDACPCPLCADGWLLFMASNHCVPDFWRADSIRVQEIAVCARGTSFLFTGETGGNLFLAALVFVSPFGESWEPRGAHGCCSPGDAHFEMRYSTLLQGLSELFGGSVQAPARFEFGRLEPGASPRIIRPWRELIFRWNGREIVLRGYLDVYLSAVV